MSYWNSPIRSPYLVGQMQYQINETYNFELEYDRDLPTQIGEATHKYFTEVLPENMETSTKAISDCEDQINDLKGRATIIKNDESSVKSYGKKIGRFFRSIGIIAAAVIAVVTIIPAIALGISLKGKIQTIFDKNVTLKSQAQLDLEKEWIDLQNSAFQDKDLRNPLRVRVQIASTVNGSVCCINSLNIYSYLKLTNQDNLDEDFKEFDDRVASINNEFSKKLF